VKNLAQDKLREEIRPSDSSSFQEGQRVWEVRVPCCLPVEDTRLVGGDPCQGTPRLPLQPTGWEGSPQLLALYGASGSTNSLSFPLA